MDNTPIEKCDCPCESCEGARSRGVAFGVAAAILASLMLTGMDAFVKVLDGLGTGEITFFRGIFGIAVLPLLPRGKGKLFTGKDKWLLHIRGIAGGFGILFFFYSLRGLTLGDAYILAELSAFFMYLLAPFFLKETPRGSLVPALIAMAAGAAIILQIWNFSAFNFFGFIGILAAFSSAVAYIAIGKLTEEEGKHSGTEIVFYFQAYSILCGIVLMPFDFVMPHGLDWLFLFALSLMAVSAQMLFTWGCMHVNSVVVCFAMYTGILFHIIAGWLFWDEILTISSWIGGALIVGGSLVLLWKTRK